MHSGKAISYFNFHIFNVKLQHLVSSISAGSCYAGSCCFHNNSLILVIIIAIFQIDRRKLSFFFPSLHEGDFMFGLPTLYLLFKSTCVCPNSPALLIPYWLYVKSKSHHEHVPLYLRTIQSLRKTEEQLRGPTHAVVDCLTQSYTWSIRLH